MYKLDLPIDSAENSAIQRRQNQELQRRSQIFDAKTRIIGVSKKLAYLYDGRGS